MKPGRALLDAAVALRAEAQWIEGHHEATWADVDAVAIRVRQAADALLELLELRRTAARREHRACLAVVLAPREAQRHGFALALSNRGGSDAA